MDTREQQSTAGKHKALEIFTVQVPGKKWDMIHDRAAAINIARQYLLTEDKVVVKDTEGTIIYRSAKPSGNK